MKKICFILLCGMLLAGCSGSGVSQGPKKKSEGGEVEILAEYTLSDDATDTKHVMVVKNHSSNPVKISTSSRAYSEDGTIIGEADDRLSALGAGCTSVLSETFDIDTQVGYYETDMTYITSSGSYFKAAEDLSYKQNDIEKGAVFQVTNNGTSTATFVEGDALFFKGEELVDYKSEYFSDVDGRIKPDKTISRQLTSHKDFDRIEFYLTGEYLDREDEGNEGGEVEILAEYTLSNYRTTHVIVVKNHSSNPVNVSTSSLAYSEDGTIIGASGASLYALGAGCTSVLSESFDIDRQVDYYETDITASTKKRGMFESEPANLSYKQNDIEKGAVFQVTNNGTSTAERVVGNALFFLGEELVDYRTEFFGDVNSEIESGKTISRQVTSNEDFDRIEFYLTGWCVDREDEKSEGGEVEILAEYTFSDDDTTHVIVVKNHSSNPVDVSTSSLAYSEDGTIIGEADASLYALGAGCTSVLSESFDIDRQVDYYETDITASTKKRGMFESEPANLSYKQNDIEKGAVFQVTNNGTKAAQGVEGHALFFKGEELVDYKSEYFEDVDWEIKPDKTISRQLTSHKDFDRIEFYLTGEYLDREDEGNEGGEVEILAEYTLSNYRTKHVIVVKNHSSNPVNISTSSLAYSEDGTVIGAAEDVLFSLGAGCTSVLSESFDIDRQVDYYETDIIASTKNYGEMFDPEPVDLSYMQNDIEKGAVFQVTNNGSSAAEYVGGDVLFFKGEQLVDYKSEYFEDLDSEIKPGKTISKQVTSHKDFDRIEFYLTGGYEK